jgi:hypothetical protein
MLRRSFLLAPAALALLMVGNARAATLVTSAAATGSGLSFTASSNGAGQVTFTVTGTGVVNQVNGGTPPVNPIDAKLDSSIVINFTTSLPSLSLSSTNPSPLTETLTDPASMATLTYNLTSGTVNDPFTLVLTGQILSAGTTSNYDYTPLIGGPIQLTFNGPTLSTPNVSSFLATSGATWSGNITFSEASNAVPEPASMALLGIGLGGVIAASRLRRAKP